ncbi:MAG TPA: adenylate/guanylate cyclase domain-containing protein, partial [Fibrobacteraceae bacterium]|nr:adenylate/guanylate cyclase domain-containing protein [Fibrobacteraceae bacterium]
DELQQVLADGRRDSPAWKHIASQLRAFQEHDSEIRFVYTMAPTAETTNRGIVQFVVDPMKPEDENGDGVIDPDEKPGEVGELYNARENSPAMLQGFSRPSYDIAFTQDKWGQFMSGYAPIRDSAGNSVGLVGVDITFEKLRHLRNAFILQCVLVILAVILTAVIISWLLSRHIAKPVGILHRGMEKVSAGELDTRIIIQTGDEFERLAERFNSMVEGLRERKRILGTLERYLSRELADLIMRQEDLVSQVRRRRVTVLFCDIEQITAFAEAASPERTAHLLSVFYEYMTEAVFRNGGVVDKLLGDGLMALFGTPLPLERQEEGALRCAVEMQQAMNKVREIVDAPKLRMGVGIHSGIVVAGNIGSAHIMDYTVIGDAVNVASRLERLSRDYPSRILASQSVVDGLQGNFKVEAGGPLEIKGRKEPILVYQVLGEKKE